MVEKKLKGKAQKLNNEATLILFMIRKKPYSHESHFIRTGKITAGLDRRKVKKLGARFLSWTWLKTSRSPKRKLPLPTFRQRMKGGKLPKADRKEIDSQINSALKIFVGHLPKNKINEIEQKIRGLITARILSVNIALREKTKGSDLKQMRTQGKELHHYFESEGKVQGEINPSLMQETTGKTYFAKGFSSDKNSESSPFHESIHALQRLGLIKLDVPFAQAAERLYGLEKGIFKVDPRMRNPTKEEFDKKPKLEKIGELNVRYEPNWSYPVGDRIGQWVFQNLPKHQRWQYMILRCNGKSHRETLQVLGRKK